jgi:hypothetical protein
MAKDFIQMPVMTFASPKRLIRRPNRKKMNRVGVLFHRDRLRHHCSSFKRVFHFVQQHALSEDIVVSLSIKACTIKCYLDDYFSIIQTT